MEHILIACSLCGMEFNDKIDALIGVIKETHERWHTRCAIEKRNTTEGKVEWLEV